MRLSILAAFVAFTVSGCATYFKDRGADFLDMAGAEVSAGLQVGVNLRATKIAQLGLAHSTGDVAVWDGRTFAGLEENRLEAGLGPFYYNQADRVVNRSNQAFKDFDKFNTTKDEWWDWDRRHDRGFFEVGGKLSLLFVGVDAHIDLLQIGDFFLGLVGLDICRDDARHADIEPVTSPPTVDALRDKSSG